MQQPATSSGVHASLPPTDASTDMAAAREAWAQLQEVESVVVTVIVDNETDGLSSPCACCDPALEPASSTPYVSEFTAGVQRVTSGASQYLDFTRSLLAGHGLSLLVTATLCGGGGVRRLLFDGGPRADLWAGNAELLEVDLAGVGGAVLSHWHVDHSCGFVAVAEAASKARAAVATATTIAATAATAAATTDAAADAPTDACASPAPFVFDVHPDRPVRRGLLMPNGKAVPFNEDVTWAQMSLPGCLVARRAEPHTLLDGCFFVSGAIPRRSAFEAGQPGHATMGANGEWRPDPHIMEERYLALRVRGQGPVVFSGCSHAGIVNVVSHVTELAGGRVFGVMGGFHLASRHMEVRIPETVAALKELDPHLIVAGHCTGWRAKAALLAAFPGRFQPCTVGGTYSFLAPTPAPPESATDRPGLAPAS